MTASWLVHADSEEGGETVAEAYAAWAREHGAVVVYRNEDDEHPLHVYAYVNGGGEFGDEDLGTLVLHQGGDDIHVPFIDLGRFVDRLESLYTDGCLEDDQLPPPEDEGAPWVTIGPEPYLATCARCGLVEPKPDLPLSMDAFGAYLTFVTVKHRGCTGVELLKAI
mgnify:CR=1 FL=1